MLSTLLRIKSPQRLPHDALPIQSGAVLLSATEERRKLLVEIERLAGVTPALFSEYYRSGLTRYAEFVQALPASYDHHHARPGGLLDHTLEAVAAALSLRQGSVLPPQATAEQVAREEQVWTWGVFTASMLHDAARPLMDQRIELFDKRGESLGNWQPWLGTMNHASACYYRVRFRLDREYRLHEKAVLLIASQILPTKGLAWLADNPVLFGYWIATVSGDWEHAGPLGEIARKGDQTSVAADVGSGKTPSFMHGATGKPLHRRLLLALRELLKSGDLPINQPGAAVWLIDDVLWLMSKRVVDAMRETAGDGVPESNIRVFEILQQHGLIAPNGDKAIWKAHIKSPDWEPAQAFSLLKMSASVVWPERERWPEPFDGEVIPVSVETPEEADQKENKSMQDDDSTENDPIQDKVELVQPPKKKTEQPSAPKPRKKAANQRNDSKAEGRAFYHWLKEGLNANDIDINKTGAPVHIVEEGVLLVSPVIFQIYAGQVGKSSQWQEIQSAFQDLRINAKNRKHDENVFEYIVKGKRKSSIIKGWILPDVGEVFGDVTPKSNEHLFRKL